MMKDVPMAIRNSLIAIVAILFSCSMGPTQTAGGTTDTGNARIIGQAFLPSGSPASGARVLLFSESADAMPTRSSALDSTEADTNGAYLFDSLYQGNYAITASIVDSLSLFVRTGIKVAVSGMDIPVTNTMMRGGALSVPVSSVMGNGVIIGIYSLYISAPAQAGSTVTLSPIPAGTWIFIAWKPDIRNQPLVLFLDTVVIAEGAVTLLDTIKTIGFPAGSSALLDDFEDGNQTNSFGGGWWTFNDSVLNGNSRILPDSATGMLLSMVVPGATSSVYAAHIAYQLGTTEPNFADMGCDIVPRYNELFNCRDFSGLKGFSVWLKGDGGRTGALLIPGVPSLPNLDILAIDSAPAAWTRYHVDIDSLLAAGDSTFQENWAASAPFIIQFVIGGTMQTGSRHELWVDSVAFEF